MSEPERRKSPELLSAEGAEALRTRAGVAEVVAANHWLASGLVATIGGCFMVGGLVAAGVTIGWSLAGGGALAVLAFASIAALSFLTGRPVVADLFAGREASVLLEERWPGPGPAAAEARSRNLKSSRGVYFIEVELEPGVWGIERRSQRAAGDGGGGSGDGAADFGWFGGDGGGGGGNGGGA